MGHDYLTYRVSDISADIVNGPCERDILATAGTKATIGDDKAVSRFAFARGMHQRTQSGSTASSSSLETEQSTDWWQENSPWAWQWGNTDTQKVGGKVAGYLPGGSQGESSRHHV